MRYEKRVQEPIENNNRSRVAFCGTTVPFAKTRTATLVDGVTYSHCSQLLPIPQSRTAIPTPWPSLPPGIAFTPGAIGIPSPIFSVSAALPPHFNYPRPLSSRTITISSSSEPPLRGLTAPLPPRGTTSLPLISLPLNWTIPRHTLSHQGSESPGFTAKPLTLYPKLNFRFWWYKFWDFTLLNLSEDKLIRSRIS